MWNYWLLRMPALETLTTGSAMDGEEVFPFPIAMLEAIRPSASQKPGATASVVMQQAPCPRLRDLVFFNALLSPESAEILRSVSESRASAGNPLECVIFASCSRTNGIVGDLKERMQEYAVVKIL